VLVRLTLAVVVVPLIAANLAGHGSGALRHVAIGLGLVVVLAVIAAVLRLSPADLGLARAAAGDGFRLGAVCVLVIAAAGLVALVLPPVRSALEGTAHPSTEDALVAVLIVIPLGTVVPEEFAFRGVLWGLIRRHDGPRVATIASSALFGLWHIVPALGGSAANQAANSTLGGGGSATALRVLGTVLLTALAGAVFCWLRIRSSSLLAPIMAHWAINSVGTLLLLAA